MQSAAFSAMQSTAADLNTKIDGQYLFAGSQVRTREGTGVAVTVTDPA